MEDLSKLPGSLPKQYEFDMEENTVIDSLAGLMKFCAWVSIVFGALNLALGLVQLGGDKEGEGIASMFQGTVMMVVGVWTRRAARAMKDIVTTEGNDIINLMAGLRELKKVYKLQAVLIGLALIVIGAVILMAIA